MGEQIRIVSPSLDDSVVVDLYTDEAPETCAAITDALPLSGKVVHGKVSGEEVFVAQRGPDDCLEVAPENWEFQPMPGEVGYWYNHWGDEDVVRGNDEPLSEIVFVYGRNVRIRKDAERPSAINVFGSICDSFDPFVELCHQSRYEENPRITLERTSD